MQSDREQEVAISCLSKHIGGIYFRYARNLKELSEADLSCVNGTVTHRMKLFGVFINIIFVNYADTQHICSSGYTFTFMSFCHAELEFCMGYMYLLHDLKLHIRFFVSGLSESSTVQQRRIKHTFF